MSDYNFMKTGNNMLVEEEELDEDITNIVENTAVIILNFMENALVSASKYIKHSGRNIITREDIRRCFMMEVFFMDKRKDTLEKCEKIKEILKEQREKLEEYEEIEIIDEDDEDEFCLSNCECALCVCINGIDERWRKFVPETNMEKILYRHIDNM